MKDFLVKILILAIKILNQCARFLDWLAKRFFSNFLSRKKLILGFILFGVFLDIAFLYLTFKTKGIEVFDSVEGTGPAIIRGFVEGYGPEIGLLIVLAAVLGLFYFIFKTWDQMIPLIRLWASIGFFIHLFAVPLVIYYIFYILLRSP